MMSEENNHDPPIYWESLGRFVQSFAMVERNFTIAALVLVSGDFEVSAPIVKGIGTLEKRMDLVRRIFPVRHRKAELLVDCERVLSQTKLIQGTRNLLLHNGTLFSDADVATTSKLLGSRNEAPVQMSADLLVAMKSDCDRIAHFWSIYAWYSRPEIYAEVAKFRPELNKPWNYNP